MSTSAALAVVAALIADPVGLPNGYLRSELPTAESGNQDTKVHGLDVERNYLPWRNLDPTKRSYFNLTQPHRQASRSFLGGSARAFWGRGAMNDLLRTIDCVATYKLLAEPFKHDRLGAVPLPRAELVDAKDAEVPAELGCLLKALTDSPGAFRLVPLSNEEHLEDMLARCPQPFAGLGALTVSYPRTDREVVVRRLQRQFRRGDYLDREFWAEVLKNYRKEMAERDGFDRLFDLRLRASTKRHTGELQDLPVNSFFERKSQIYQATWGGDLEGSFDRVIELLADLELLQAGLAERGQGQPGGDPARRNQMDGLCLRIGSAAAQYLQGPGVYSLLRLGALGVVGTTEGESVVPGVPTGSRPSLTSPDGGLAP